MASEPSQASTLQSPHHFLALAIGPCEPPAGTLLMTRTTRGVEHHVALDIQFLERALHISRNMSSLQQYLRGKYIRNKGYTTNNPMAEVFNEMACLKQCVVPVVVA